MLAACAGPRMAQELQAGKMSFEAGYYKEAFRQLLPLAVKGKAEAQYAVGYMYYYGYGVAEDAESGMFWMTKAAEQHYLPAVKALQLIHQHDAEAESMLPARQPNRYEKRDEVMQTMHDQRQQYVPVTPPKELKKISYTVTEDHPPEPPIKIASSLKEKQELPQQESIPRKYALQLYGSYHLSAVKNLQSQLRLKNTGHIYQTMHQGKDWYVLTFGNFVTVHEASATQNNLPGELKKMHPWVRDIRTCRQI